MRLRIPGLAAPLVAFALVVGLATGAAAAAPVAEPTADDIVGKALGKGTVGFKTGKATLQMKIVSAKGDAKDRTLEIKANRSAEGLLRSLVRFTKPAEVNGISFLVIEKKDALPDQYVYVPAAKVVRRVAAGNATSSFFGSDFTFGDLMPLPTSDRSKVEIVKKADTEVGGQQVYLIEITPKIEGSPYGRLAVYVQKQQLVPLKIEFFDPSMKPLKTLKVKRLKKVGADMVPVEMEMSAASGSRTELTVVETDEKATFTDADFTEEAMQR